MGKYLDYFAESSQEIQDVLDFLQDDYVRDSFNQNKFIDVFEGLKQMFEDEYMIHKNILIAMLFDANIPFLNHMDKIPRHLFQEWSIETLEIPEGITAIESSAFVDANIQLLILPSTLTVIGQNAFRYSEIGDIKYNGSLSEWKKINIYYGNSPLQDAELWCMKDA